MRKLLAHRDARIYLAGQVLSLFGDACLSLAMGIWVKTLTGSNGAAGLVFFCFAAANLFAPAAGLLVDRVRRRPLLIAVNAGTAGVVLLLLFVQDRGQIWLIDTVIFGYGLSYTVLGPARSALLTTLLPGELLADANGALRTAQESLRLVGPLVGAGLFAAAGARPVVIIAAATSRSRSSPCWRCASWNQRRTLRANRGMSRSSPASGTSAGRSSSARS